MDDLLSRVTIDPLAIKYPSRGEAASAGLVAETTVSGCLDNLDGRVTALEGAPAGGGVYLAQLSTVAGNNQFRAGPAGVEPVMARISLQKTVCTFINPNVGADFSTVVSVDDATRTVYTSAFAFAAGGIDITAVVGAPAVGDFHIQAFVTAIVELYY